MCVLRLDLNNVYLSISAYLTTTASSPYNAECCNIPVEQICVSCLIKTWCFISDCLVTMCIYWIIWECEWDTDTVTFLYLDIFIHQTRHEFSDGSVCWNISRVMILIPGWSSVCPPSLCYNARSLNICFIWFNRKYRNDLQ